MSKNLQTYECFLRKTTNGTALIDYESRKEIVIQTKDQGTYQKLMNFFDCCEMFGHRYYNPIYNKKECIKIEGNVIEETDDCITLIQDEDIKWGLI